METAASVAGYLALGLGLSACAGIVMGRVLKKLGVHDPEDEPRPRGITHMYINGRRIDLDGMSCMRHVSGDEKEPVSAA